jgi:hypothetical protein
MKAVLEFNLPEEEFEFDLASKSFPLLQLVEDLDKELRSFLKYGTTPFNKSSITTPEEMADAVREWIGNETVNRKLPSTY